MVAEFCHNLLLNILLGVLKFRSTPRFQKWIRLEEQKNKILKAVEESSDEFPRHLLDFLSTALCFPSKYFEKASWWKLVNAFYVSLNLTRCQFTLPIFDPSQEKVKEDAWNYEDRTWHIYVHLLAKTYGWTIEYISNLRLRDALTAIQEILTDDQLDREFQWTMSERSSYYDSHSKTSKANPLPRPSWMHKHIDPTKEARVTQIPTNMMPVGNGISQSEIIAQTINAV